MIIINNMIEMELQYDKIQANSNSDELYQMHREINDVKSKLLECQKEYEYTEVEIHNVNQLKDKGMYVLNNVERNYNNLDEELKQIHCNYVKCIEKVNDNDTIQQRINSLTMQRDNLRKKLDELKKATDENNKKLIEIKNMIIIQEVHFIIWYIYINIINIIKLIFIFLFLEKKYGINTKIKKNYRKCIYYTRFKKKSKYDFNGFQIY